MVNFKHGEYMIKIYLVSDTGGSEERSEFS